MLRYQSGQMVETVNLAAQAFEGSNPPLSTTQSYKACWDSKFIPVLGQIPPSAQHKSITLAFSKTREIPPPYSCF